MCFRASRRFIVVAATLFLARCAMFCDDSGFGKHANLALTVQKSADKTRTLPGSALYQADLINRSKEAVMLQAVQLPDESAGYVEDFYCSLDAWRPDQSKWALLWSSHVGLSTNSGPHLKDIVVKPGERVRVCSLLLPAQIGKNGQCVRYRLSTRWKRDRPHHILYSRPFVIGDKPPLRGSPCLIN
jgi:hypothetical protein